MYAIGRSLMFVSLIYFFMRTSCIIFGYKCTSIHSVETNIWVCVVAWCVCRWYIFLWERVAILCYVCVCVSWREFPRTKIKIVWKMCGCSAFSNADTRGQKRQRPMPLLPVLVWNLILSIKCYTTHRNLFKTFPGIFFITTGLIYYMNLAFLRPFRVFS